MILSTQIKCGEGGFQIVHVSPQGGKGVKEMIYVNIPEGGIWKVHMVRKESAISPY